MTTLKPSCANSSSKSATLEKDIVKLREDLTALNAKVDEFRAEDALSITTQELNANDVKSKVLNSDYIIGQYANIAHEYNAYNRYDSGYTEIEFGNFSGAADLYIKLKQDKKEQVIKIATVDGVAIAISDSNILVDKISVLTDKGRTYFRSENKTNKPVAVLVHPKSDDWQKTNNNVPASATLVRDITIGDRITFAGNLTYESIPNISFDVGTVKDLTITDKLHIKDYELNVNEPDVISDIWTKVNLQDGTISFNNGDVVMSFNNLGLYKAHTSVGYSIQEGTDGLYYIYHKGTTTYSIDYVFSTDKADIVPNSAPDVSKVICEDDENYIDEMYTRAIKSDMATITAIDALDINTGSINIEDRLDATDAHIGTSTTDDATVLNELTAGNIILDKEELLPALSSNDETDIVFNFTTGMVMGEVKDGEETKLSFTAIKNTTTSSNVIVSFSQSTLDGITHAGVTKDGKLTITTQLQNLTLRYGYSGTNENVFAATVVNNTDEKEINNVITGYKHTVILGDNTTAYGLRVNGEVMADRIPLPGVTSYENVDVSNELNVGVKATLGSLDVTNAPATIQGEQVIVDKDIYDNKIVKYGVKTDANYLYDKWLEYGVVGSKLDWAVKNADDFVEGDVVAIKGQVLDRPNLEATVVAKVTGKTTTNLYTTTYNLEFAPYARQVGNDVMSIEPTANELNFGGNYTTNRKMYIGYKPAYEGLLEPKYLREVPDTYIFGKGDPVEDNGLAEVRARNFVQNGVQVTTTDDIATAFIYKGTKATIAELPTADNLVGDTWYVTDQSALFVWNGTGWDKVNVGVDITTLATKEELGVETKAREDADKVLEDADTAIRTELGNGTLVPKEAGNSATLENKTAAEVIVPAQLPVGSVITIEAVSQAEANGLLPKYGAWAKR